MNSQEKHRLTANIQELLSLDRDRLLKYIVKNSNTLLPTSEIQYHEAISGQIVFESDVDGCHYCLVKCESRPCQKFKLSPREREIANLIARGFSNKGIGQNLNISFWTVNTHLRRIFGKLGVSSRAAMVAKLMEGH
jgi:DNA-binding NarL/FixJ family response regulator